MFSSFSAQRTRRGSVVFKYIWLSCKPKSQILLSFRILIVKQTGEVLPPLTKSSQNATLVDVVMKSILPASTHIQSTQEVANAVERHLQTPTDIWTSWTVRKQQSESALTSWQPDWCGNLSVQLRTQLCGTPCHENSGSQRSPIAMGTVKEPR